MQIEIGGGAFLVDAALLGELLDVSPSNVVSLMRDLAITSTCEKGIDIHQNEFRLTFFHGNRRARLRIDKSGHILQRSIIDFGERPRWSGRIEARTGLRMMPTFPRSPLSFRTAGFPQYGWKAGVSGETFPARHSA